MGNWEDVFRESAQPPGKTEQDRCANAESAIKSAIKASAKLNARDIKILNNRGLYGMVIFGPGVRVATVSVSHFDAKRASSKKMMHALFLLKAFGRGDERVEMALSLSKGPSIFQ